MSIYAADPRAVEDLGPYPVDADPIGSILALDVRIVRQRLAPLFDAEGTPIPGEFVWSPPYPAILDAQIASLAPDLLFGGVGGGVDAAGMPLDDVMIVDDGPLALRLLRAFQIAQQTLDPDTIIANVTAAQTAALGAVADVAALDVRTLDLEALAGIGEGAASVNGLDDRVAQLESWSFGASNPASAVAGSAEARIADLEARCDALTEALAAKVSFSDLSVMAARLDECDARSVDFLLQLDGRAASVHSHAVADIGDVSTLATDIELADAIAGSGGPPPNHPPVSTVVDIDVSGMVVTGHAAATDVDGDTLSFSWGVSQQGAQAVTFAGADLVFVAPTPGAYRITAWATDGKSSPVLLRQADIVIVAPPSSGLTGSWTMTRRVAFPRSFSTRPGSVDTLHVDAVGACTSPDSNFWLGTIATTEPGHALFTSSRTGVQMACALQPDGTWLFVATSGAGTYSAAPIPS